MRRDYKSFVFILFVLVLGQTCFAQRPQQENQPPTQPLNASVSDFGTSFIFSPPPICSGCVEAELGFLSLQDVRLLPTVVSVAPFKTRTDFSVLVNMLDSGTPVRRRTIKFGNRFDFVIRQQVFEKDGFVLTVAPRGTVFTRDVDGGRAGATLAAQCGKGNNLVVTNFTLTGAIGGSSINPKTDYQGSFDYYRTLNGKGLATFVGFQHEVSSENSQLVSTEQGLVLPFRNGQVELAVEQLNLNTRPVWQFQARVIVNISKVLHK